MLITITFTSEMLEKIYNKMSKKTRIDFISILQI